MSPTWSPDGQWIAFGFGSFFNARQNKPAHVMMVRVDGSERKDLTNGSANSGFPSWSPDGKRIVFRAWGDEHGLRILNLEDNSVKTLTNDYDNFPSWSPNGDRITFTRAFNHAFDIFSVQPDGSDLKQLTDAPGNDAHTTWSPDGKHILFNSGRDGSIPLLYVINPDGSGIRRLCPKSHLWEEYPDWSPDGTKIAFMSNVGFSSWVIFVMNVDCSGLKQVTQGPGEDGGPRWSPDGKKIAFTSNRTGRAEVYVMNADGSQQTRLTTSSKVTSFNSPDWSPDGTRFLYMHSLPHSGEIWVMNADGSGQTKLMDAYGFGDGPVWQP